MPYCLLIFLFFILLFPCFARAEPVSSDIGEVLVEGEGDKTSPEKPTAFTSVIHPEDYDERLVTLPELLSEQVGVHLRSFGGLGQLSTISIRGSTSEQVSVYLDGIKINTAQGGAVDFSTIPLGAIERVEVLRGGASSIFGTDAVGGVINIITKRAQAKPAYQFRFSEGSFFTIETEEGFSKTFGKTGLTFNHTHLSSDGDFPFLSTPLQLSGGESIGGGKKFTRIHNGFFSEGVLARVDSQLALKHRLTFTNDFFMTSRDLPGTELETTQLFPNNPLDAHQNLFRNAAGLQWIWNDAGVKGLDFSLQPNYRFEWSHFNDATPALGGPIDVTSLNQAFGIRPKAVYSKAFANQDHQFSLLYDFRYEHFNDSSEIPGANLSGPHERFTNALFFQDEINLLGEKLLFNPSVRYEHTNDFGGSTSLHFGVVGKPLSWLSLKSNVENSFRYPNFNELFFPDEGFIRGNPDLQKEESIQFDVGAEVRYSWFNLELDYFYSKIDNSIVFVPISSFTIAPINTGPATAQGLEASITLRPLKFLTLSGNYTYLHAILDSTGQQLPGRPRHLANGRAEFSWKYGSVFSEVQFTDQLPIDFVNTRFISDQTLVNVGGTFRWKDHYFVSLEGKNVGNVQPLDSVGFPLPRASVYLSFGYKS